GVKGAHLFKIEWIRRIAQGRTFVDGLAVGISELEGKVPGCVAYRHLEGVVAVVAERSLKICIAQSGSKRSALSIGHDDGRAGVSSRFSVRTASRGTRRHRLRSAQGETQRGIPRVERISEQQVVRLGTDIGDVQDRPGSEFPFDRKEILFIIWKGIIR